MSGSSGPTPQELEEKGVLRLGLGAGLGFAGAICAIVIPLVFLFLAAEYPGGFFTWNSMFVEVTSILLIAGAILLLISLFVYRRSFAALRKVDRRFVLASVLCILGSLGFLLLLVALAVVANNTGSLLTCVHGQPSHALKCLESGQPLGAYTGLVGFFLGWLGGLGIVLGLVLAGSRFHTGVLTAGGAMYALLLIVLILPFVTLFVSVPGGGYLVLLAPVFAVIGPALALAGSARSREKLGAPAA
jgi:MFS family permease